MLVGALHDEIKNAKIAYLFKETMGSGDRVDLGKATRTSGPLKYLSERDFVVLFNWTAWAKLNAMQRIALVDHELCHCGRDDEGKFVVLHHDVEEFGAVVRRWGLWTDDLHRFADVVKDQLEIFPDSGK